MKKINNPTVHPRLYFGACDIAKVKEQLSENLQMQKWLKILEDDAKSQMNMVFHTEEHANSIYDQHGRFADVRAQTIKMTSLSLCYQLTGSTDYAAKVKEAMLYFASFKSWAGPLNKDRETPWRSELNTAAILENYALAWDLIHDTLNETDKKTISEAMIRNGILPLMEDWVLPKTRVHTLDSMGHNWWAVCIGLAGVGICAIYEYVPLADEWLEQICNALHAFLEYPGGMLLNKTPNFDDKYLFYEGTRYANYGVGEMAHFSYVYHRFTGVPPTYPAQLLAESFVSMAYPVSHEKTTYQFINFGDANRLDAMIQMPLFFTLMNAFDGIKINSSTAFLLRDLYQMYRNRTATATALDFVFYNILWVDEKDELSDLPLSAVHKNGGCAVLRSSWEKDALLFAVRCGYTWNHTHDDGGSFVLFDKGVPLLTDLGAYSYGNPMHRGYNLKARGHNVVVANAKGQFEENNSRGTKFPGAISQFIENDWCVYMLADATGPLCDRYQRNYRSFIRLYGDCFLILDEIRTYHPATFEWLLHYEGDAQIIGGGKEIVVQNGVGMAKVYPVFPRALAVEKRDVYSTAYHASDTYCKYLSLARSDGSPVREAIFLNLITTGAALECRPIEAVHCFGTEFSHKGVKIEMYYNQRADGRNMHVNTTNNLGGYETDAYILVKASEGEKNRYLLVYGSYLRKEGLSLYENYSKGFVFV